MTDQAIEVRPIAGALGAEIFGVDLAKPLSNAQFADIHQALLDHLVIFFRDQDLTIQQHKDFGRRFGPLELDRFVVPLEGHPETMVVSKEPDEKRNFGNGWHQDVLFQEKPALGSILYALQTPPIGGDTMFANQYLAYESLSDGMKAMLDGLRAANTAEGGYGKATLAKNFDGQGRSIEIRRDRQEEAEREMLHPVVRTHPETGRKALFVCNAYTKRLEGMTVEESAPLLHYLYRHAVRPEFTCRFDWRKGSLAFWDNRCTQHYPINDYQGHRRLAHRVTVGGDRPA